MSISEHILQEHREILSSLKNVIRLARHLEKGGALKVEQVMETIASLKVFHGQVHHAKEEMLFQLLALREIEENELALLMELEAEHKAANELLNNIVRLILQKVPHIQHLRNSVMENLWTFVELSRCHIAKEERNLIPLFERYFTPTDKARIRKHFNLPQGPLHAAPDANPGILCSTKT